MICIIKHWLGNLYIKLNPPKAVTCNDLYRKYEEKNLEKCSRSTIFTKNPIYITIKFPPEASWVEGKEILDNYIKELIFTSENKCCKLRTGGIYFSHNLNIWMIQRKTWNIINQSRNGHYTSPTLIRREPEKKGVSHPLDTLLEEQERIYKSCGNEFEGLKPKCHTRKLGYFNNKLYLVFFSFSFGPASNVPKLTHYGVV